jgi:DNA-binding NtrC family response regulator
MPMMIGRSPQWRDLVANLHRFATCDVPVLLEGETGTGKELAAREIHYSGSRASEPFVPVNCGALQDSLIESELFGHLRGAFTDAKSAQIGLVEHARGGTLFLDEVDALSQKAQVTLLRFLQDREYRPVGGGVARAVNVRVIAATNASLEQLASGGHFRRDLLYRLNPLYARLPALREREGDMQCLAEHFLASAVQRLGTSPRRWADQALRALAMYVWPGNVRELENVALRVCLHSDGEYIGIAELVAVEPALALAARVAESRTQDDAATFVAAKTRAVAVFERGYLTSLMHKTDGNISKAAQLSGTERRQLGKLLKKHGIQRQQFRS